MDEKAFQQLVEINPGMTSMEAAAMYLSNGATKDPQLAAIGYANAADTPMIGQQSLVLDKEQRAELRAMMGFSFTIKQTPSKIHVYSKEGPKLSTHCKYSGPITEETVDRLVDACLRLKTKWEAERDVELGSME